MFVESRWEEPLRDEPNASCNMFGLPHPWGNVDLIFLWNTKKLKKFEVPFINILTIRLYMMQEFEHFFFCSQIPAALLFGMNFLIGQRLVNNTDYYAELLNKTNIIRYKLKSPSLKSLNEHRG